MILTKRQREILQRMADRRHDDEGELVMEGREVWLGLERSSVAMVFSLLRVCAIRLVSGEPGGCERYEINETGLKLLAGNDEDLKLLKKAQA